MIRQIPHHAFNVVQGPAALRTSRGYWYGVASGNWVWAPSRRRRSSDKALDDAREIERRLAGQQPGDGNG